ncbi:50S ribosomal protein L16 arginine hydroxylase [Pseudoalteromonas luteoviolacea]|uniref:50S ribosomal protein L16 arginine hydroxylase n=1 Tax=Pseudoalteromonas luteoviolacea TaxID=43657 RepID=A0A0C1QCS3_9GAMM|nr:cupin domain-containing protein [Pseudoalteromonas luteoviolacea]KID57220.1 50S ribosomal protein L16 arginine hydroxylase [Pseudoalteromonas luteoviolacea]
MYQLSINNMSPETFLKEYWQKKPLLIKGGFKDFQDPLSAEELAGLAMEDSIESRLITNHDENWLAHHGPFENFDKLTETNSTLLVQAVDHWHPPAAELLEPFRFIPNWRIDDLMISYSTPKGGVGPHLDQYDVFIIQGEGKRHWRVGMPDANLKQFTKDKALLQVEQFEAIIDEVLEPGDILYIPPGCPHEGYAVENALNYSVGFRAPDQKDLISSFADHIIDEEAGKSRYSDADLNTRPSIGEINLDDKLKIQAMLTGLIENDTLYSQWLGTYLSQPKHDMDLAPLDDALVAEFLEDEVEPHDTVIRSGGVRAIYQVADTYILLSVNGENYTLPKSTLEQVKLLTDSTTFSFEQVKPALISLEFKQTLTTLINDGLFYIEAWS